MRKTIVGFGSVAGMILVGACFQAGDSTSGTGGFNFAGSGTGADGSGAQGSGTAGTAGAGNGMGGTTGDGGVGNAPTVPDGLGIGDDCTDPDAGECRPGLSCDGGACAPSGETDEGAACVVGPECADGLICVGGSCVTEGAGDAGATCASDVDCMKGLRCGLAGLALKCVAEGTVDNAGACNDSSECYSGLACINDVCAPYPASLPGIGPVPGIGLPTYAGVACDDPTEADVKAYFEIPGAAGSETLEDDFYRVPFPNDAMLTEDGHPDYSGFPEPGKGVLPVDVIKLYADTLTAEADRFSANPTVVFRFDGLVNFESLRDKPDPDNAGETLNRIRFVDLTEPGRPASAWYVDGNDNKYTCATWLAVRNQPWSPLEAGHQYAVILETGIRGADGENVARPPQLEALLGATAPSDAALGKAYTAYRPLRDYITATDDITTADVLNAAVFTVGDQQKPMRDLAAAVESAAAPTIKSWTKCDDGVASPCAQAEGGRACGASTADYDEYHALIELPIFQQGDAPYLESGGNIVNTPVRTEDVCMAVTVPTGAAPADGWPLAVYGHGTGGGFRSHIRDEVAGVMARATPKFAVVGIDLPQHGPRRGDSTEDPETLFFNFLNPGAARGNPMQGAADALGVLKAMETLDVTVGSDAIKIDGTKMVLFGHSQGSTHFSLAAPYATRAKGAVFSGQGALLLESLLAKTEPVNIAQVIPFALQETGSSLPGGTFHPALSLLQHWIDPADPVNFGPLLRDPDSAPLHVFQTYGVGDSYSPPTTMQAYAKSADFPLVTPPSGFTPDDPWTTGNVPVGLSGNVSVTFTGDAAATTLTQGLRQYGPPSGRDGHFVVFDVAEANGDVVRFLSAIGAGTTPAIGQ